MFDIRELLRHSPMPKQMSTIGQVQGQGQMPKPVMPNIQGLSYGFGVPPSTDPLRKLNRPATSLQDTIAKREALQAFQGSGQSPMAFNKAQRRLRWPYAS